MIRAAFLTCVIALAVGSPAFAQDPDPSMTFQQALTYVHAAPIIEYKFGTNPDKNVTNTTQLGWYFNPYGIAGQNIINDECEVYQPFSSTDNFQFEADSLDLVATDPTNSLQCNATAQPPQQPFNSAQIWTQATYRPAFSGSNIYAFEVRMWIPHGQGMWPASWFYTQTPGETDKSEIDNPEFFYDNQYTDLDWTAGFGKSPNVGAAIYGINPSDLGHYKPGLIFSADYHDYQTIWTGDAVYKYVDGTLIYASYFNWSAPGWAQLGVNLAVGSSDTTDLPGLLPTSTSEFPARLSIDHISIWGNGNYAP